MVRLDDARRVIAAAEKISLEMGQPMNIAVADGGGNLVAHVRMDGAWIGSIDIAIKKAFTARAFACGRCRTCREQQTGVCLNVNPARAGGAYGYVDIGGWVGGQAEMSSCRMLTSTY